MDRETRTNPSLRLSQEESDDSKKEGEKEE